jgi:cytochrome b561
MTAESEMEHAVTAAATQTIPVAATPTRYGAVSQTFHWLTAILVGAAFLLGEGGPEARVYVAERASTLNWHETLGILVIVVVVFRLVWRFFDPAPEEPPMPAWMHLSSRLVHWALYALLFTVPLTAIFGAWWEGHAVTFFGREIGPYGTLAHDFGHTITEIHSTLGNAILWVAGLHAAAALFHHFIMRDSVLISMLPFGGGKA